MNFESFQNMDIKDLVLIGGGLFTVVIIIHGFVLAVRARRAPLRMEITPDLVPNDGEDDDLAYLRGELPNGGARLVRPLQRGFDFDDAPERVEPVVSPRTSTQSTAGMNARRASSAPSEEGSRHGQMLNTDAQSPHWPDTDDSSSTGPDSAETTSDWSSTESATSARSGNTDQEPTPMFAGATSLEWPETGGEVEHGARRQHRNARAETEGDAPHRGAESVERRESEESRASEAAAAESSTRDLVIVNLFAPDGKAYAGESLLAAMRNQGLKHGEMNIFHRIDPITGAVRYSIANVVEPGYFDMRKFARERSPGLVFFLRLAGSMGPGEAVEDLLRTAAAMADELGAVLKDENMAALTPQRIHHYRDRVAEYTRQGQSRQAGAI